MQFASIPYQNNQAEVFQRLIQSNRISHAQLFSGREGCPNMQFALAFANALVCEQPEHGDACGKCDACTKSFKFVHPDIQYSFPVVKKDKKSISEHFLPEFREYLAQQDFPTAFSWQKAIGAENKQLNLSVEECQSIVRRLQLKPFEAKFKVMIIWLPEYLKDAGNILLKIMEEPPENTVLLLVSNNESGIIQTILSRTQISRFALPSFEECSNYLASNFQLDSAESHRLAILSGRNIAEARKLVEDDMSWVNDLLVNTLRAVIKPNFNSMQEIAEQFATLGRENQKYFWSYAIHFSRECLLFANKATETPAIQEAELKAANYFIERLQQHQWEQIVHLFEEGLYHISRNANPKLNIRYIILQMANVVHRDHANLQLI